MFKRTAFILFCMVLVHASCSYKFTGASIPPEMKTVSVQFFENNATLVVPYLSQQFTEALKDRIRNQSRLSLVKIEGDADFEGRITDYSIRPVAVEGNQRAGLSRITVTVNVKYTNKIDAKQDFEQSFSVSRELDIQTRPLQAQEPDIIKEINRQLTEDIYNKAFANW